MIRFRIRHIIQTKLAHGNISIVIVCFFFLLRLHLIELIEIVSALTI